MNWIRIAHFFFVMIAAIPLLSQTGAVPALDSSGIQAILYSFSEKVYLQLDGKVYTKGNIIRFKSIVLSAENHRPSSLSGILYVELVDSDQTIMERKLIKLDNGIGQGFFELFESNLPGTYLIRAYTQWNKNFGPDSFFKEYIQVFANDQGIQGKPINDVRLIKEETDAYRLSANFDPLVIDSLHEDKLKVSITLGNKVDSVYLKRDKEDTYLLNYTFSNNSRLARLQMQTANNEVYTSTIILDQEYFDLQFLPESGELVHGLTSKVGFKALDASGRGKMIAGDIVDEEENIIASFKSNSLGMGSFLMEKVDSTKKYYARIRTEAPEQKSLLYPLPKVASLGNVLSIEKKEANLLLTLQSNYLENDSVYMAISHRGKRLYDIKVGLLYNGTSKLDIPCEKLPDGIIAFTLMDPAGQPVAERIYFNENQASRIKINLTANKDSYDKRDLTELTIETVDQENNPIPAHVSVLAISKKQLGNIQQQRQNILSYFLLDSELKGEIEKPGLYFNKDSSMHEHLDALMLTQGWRKYNYNKPEVPLNHLPETNLTVSGHVTSVFSKKKTKQPTLTLTTFGNNPTVAVQEADSLGNFTFNLNEEYGQQVNVLIQSAKASGKKMNYNITIDEKVSPTVNFNLENTIVAPDSLVDDFVRKDLQRKKIEQYFDVEDGSILLDELEFAGTRLTEDQEEVRDKHGEPDVIIDGAVIAKKEQKWSSGLFGVLQNSFPGKIRIMRAGNGALYANAANNMFTFIMVDGNLVLPHELVLVPNIPPSEVSNIEIIEDAAEFINLWCKMFPNDCDEYPQSANIIAIYTHGQKGIYGTKRTPGMVHTSIPVFSAPREFYTPRYDRPNLLSELPDLRTLLHWTPELVTNKEGKTSTSYYNGDNVGDMMVAVEAVSADGSIGYQELEYKVEGQETVIVEF